MLRVYGDSHFYYITMLRLYVDSHFHNTTMLKIYVDSRFHNITMLRLFLHIRLQTQVQNVQIKFICKDISYDSRLPTIGYQLAMTHSYQPECPGWYPWLVATNRNFSFRTRNLDKQKLRVGTKNTLRRDTSIFPFLLVAIYHGYQQKFSVDCLYSIINSFRTHSIQRVNWNIWA